MCFLKSDGWALINRIDGAGTWIINMVYRERFGMALGEVLSVASSLVLPSPPADGQTVLQPGLCAYPLV